MSNLLRAVITDPAVLAEFDRLEARRALLANRRPWRDDDFNEMIAINRAQVALAALPAKEEAA